MQLFPTCDSAKDRLFRASLGGQDSTKADVAKKGSKQVLRLLAVLLLATLLGSGGVAAGIVAGVPAIVQFMFVGSLALFIVTLTTGAVFARPDDGARPRGQAASVGAINPLHANERRLDLQPTEPTSRARRRLARAGARLQPARRTNARWRRRSLPSLDRSIRQAPKSLHFAN
jgi:uncharacterized membrane protein YtjA (UPF0391 family)